MTDPKGALLLGLALPVFVWLLSLWRWDETLLLPLGLTIFMHWRYRHWSRRAQWDRFLSLDGALLGRCSWAWWPSLVFFRRRWVWVLSLMLVLAWPGERAPLRLDGRGRALDNWKNKTELERAAALMEASISSSISSSMPRSPRDIDRLLRESSSGAGKDPWSREPAVDPSESAGAGHRALPVYDWPQREPFSPRAHR